MHLLLIDNSMDETPSVGQQENGNAFPCAETLGLFLDMRAEPARRQTLTDYSSLNISAMKSHRASSNSARSSMSMSIN